MRLLSFVLFFFISFCKKKNACGQNQIEKSRIGTNSECPRCISLSLSVFMNDRKNCDDIYVLIFSMVDSIGIVYPMMKNKLVTKSY